MTKVYSKYALENDFIKGYEDYIMDLSEEAGLEEVPDLFKAIMYCEPIQLTTLDVTPSEIKNQINSFIVNTQYENGFSASVPICDVLPKRWFGKDVLVERVRITDIEKYIKDEEEQVLDLLAQNCMLDLLTTLPDEESEDPDNPDMIDASLCRIIIYNGYIIGLGLTPSMDAPHSLYESISYVISSYIAERMQDFNPGYDMEAPSPSDTYPMLEANVPQTINIITDPSDEEEVVVSIDLKGNLAVLDPSLESASFPDPFRFTRSANSPIVMDPFFNEVYASSPSASTSWDNIISRALDQMPAGVSGTYLPTAAEYVGPYDPTPSEESLPTTSSSIFYPDGVITLFGNPEFPSAIMTNKDITLKLVWNEISENPQPPQL